MFSSDDWGDFGGLARGWHGGGHRARRGDMRPIILRMLETKPMHGYEIISALEEKSHGMWRPSAGSVYPTLQLLEEEELVTSQEVNGKKVYTLTDKGTAEAKKSEDFKAHWEDGSKHSKHFKDLRFDVVEIMTLLKQISHQNDDNKNEEVKKVFKETKEKLSKIANEE